MDLAITESLKLTSAHFVADSEADAIEKAFDALSLGPALTTPGVSVIGATAAPDSVLDALSIGTKEQLATLRRRRGLAVEETWVWINL